VCSPKHAEELRNIGIINFTTRLHLVGSFYEKFISVGQECSSCVEILYLLDFVPSIFPLNFVFKARFLTMLSLGKFLQCSVSDKLID
jgi:hypothetical protein